MTDACPKCGLRYRSANDRYYLPPPFGSLNAAHPAELCQRCHAELVQAVNTWLGVADDHVTAWPLEFYTNTGGAAYLDCQMCSGDPTRGGEFVVLYSDDPNMPTSKEFDVAELAAWVVGHMAECPRDTPPGEVPAGEPGGVPCGP